MFWGGWQATILKGRAADCLWCCVSVIQLRRLQPAGCCWLDCSKPALCWFCVKHSFYISIANNQTTWATTISKKIPPHGRPNVRNWSDSKWYKEAVILNWNDNWKLNMKTDEAVCPLSFVSCFVSTSSRLDKKWPRCCFLCVAQLGLPTVP